MAKTWIPDFVIGKHWNKRVTVSFGSLQQEMKSSLFLCDPDLTMGFALANRMLTNQMAEKCEGA